MNKIFQIFLNNKPIPTELKIRSKHLQKNNPNLEYNLYNDSMCREFLRENYGNKLLSTYDSLIPKAFKADLVRYALLYKYGGYYVDIGLKSHKPLTPTSEFICLKDGHALYTMGFLYSPTPKLKLFEWLIKEIVKNVRDKIYSHHLSITGPLLFSKGIEKYSNLPIKAYNRFPPTNKNITTLQWYDNGELVLTSKPKGDSKGLEQFGILPEDYEEMFNNKKIYK